jgi:hypothetical protein
MLLPEWDVEYLQTSSAGSHAVKFKGRIIPRQRKHANTVTRRQSAMMFNEQKS